MPKPAILQVIPALEAGGAERTTIEMARALVRDGFDAIVASEGGRLEADLVRSGAIVVRMMLDTKAPHGIARNAMRLVSVIRNRGVGIVHARSRAPAWSALAAARAARVPFVTTYHGIYNASNALKRFYNSVMVRSDAIIANSEWTADHIVKEHGVLRGKINVIPRGVDLEEFDAGGVSPERIEKLRASWGAGANHVVILLPGRLTRWKGQLILVEALSQLARAGRTSGIRAVLAGDAQGRDRYIAELHEAIEAAQLQDVVVITGHVGDMPAAFLASDIVVSASTDPEAFGRVAAEAGAMGRAVIATDHGGARETVLPGLSGLLVPPGDAGALANAIQQLVLAGDQTRLEMGERARAHIRANFSLERMCAATIAVYRRLLGQ